MKGRNSGGQSQQLLSLLAGPGEWIEDSPAASAEVSLAKGYNEDPLYFTVTDEPGKSGIMIGWV